MILFSVSLPRQEQSVPAILHPLSKPFITLPYSSLHPHCLLITFTAFNRLPKQKKPAFLVCTPFLHKEKTLVKRVCLFLKEVGSGPRMRSLWPIPLWTTVTALIGEVVLSQEQGAKAQHPKYCPGIPKLKNNLIVG